jgi:hypothetical protein
MNQEERYEYWRNAVQTAFAKSGLVLKEVTLDDLVPEANTHTKTQTQGERQ